MTKFSSFIKKYIVLDFVIKAVALALVTYSVIVYCYLNNIVSGLSLPFNNMVNMIEINKQKIIMQSLFAESELNSPELTQRYNPLESNVGHVYKYTKDADYSLNDHEKSIMAVLAIAQKYTPDAFSNEQVYLLYRSYESQTYISTSEIPNFPVEVLDSMNTEARCREIRVCTKFESDVNLSDRVLISPFYSDLLTGKVVVTLASPIYGEQGTEIFGDLNADFHIGDYFSNNFELYSVFQGGFKQNVVADKQITSDFFAYTTSFAADDNTVFVLKLSYKTIYLHHIWIFYALFILFYILIYKWKEVTTKRRELLHAHEDSVKDALTGLYNRKVFDSESFIDKVRFNSGSIIAIDGNKIKYINDTYGHSVGDLSIQCIADNMKECFRTSDFLIRMGGDEFIVILPGCSYDNAEILSKRLQQSIESSSFYHEKIDLTVSCGVVFSKSDESFQDAILRADEVLYEQKNNRYSNEK